MKADLFIKKRLTHGQVRSVAQRRLDDAAYLCGSGQNARGNGAIYLGGFALECWLKALLLEAHPWLETPFRPNPLSPQDRELWSLIYRLHDLSELLNRLPRLTARIKADNPSAAERLQWMCGRWTAFIRYSPASATIAEAREFVDQIKGFKRWLV